MAVPTATAAWPHSEAKDLRNRRSGDRRYRVGREDQQTSVQARQINWAVRSKFRRSGDRERCI